jgi:hypothetical protein
VSTTIHSRLLLLVVLPVALLLAATPSPVDAHVVAPHGAAARTEGHAIDEWGTRVTGVPLCAKERDLDCIDGVRVRTGGTWQTPRLISAERRNSPEGDEFLTAWEYSPAIGEGVQFLVYSSMSPRGVLRDGVAALDHGLRIMLARVPDADHPWMDVDDLECSLGNVDTCILGAPRLPEDDFFEVTARTSWLIDNGVGVNGHDMSVHRRDVPGGSRWVFGARQFLVPQPAKWDEVTPALGWVGRLSFEVGHAGDGTHDSAFDPRCAEHGAPWKSINSAGSGRLKWARKAQTLDFQIFSPHLDPHGNPLVGDFTAVVPLKWLHCMAEKKVNPAHFSVAVFDEGGEQQAATTAIRVRKGVVYVRATGFHFSSPAIRLKTKR